MAIPLREHMEKFPPVESNWFNSYRWKPALAAAGLIKPLDPNAKGRRGEKSRDMMMHALRHLYASMMINGGVDVYTLGAGSKIRIAVRSAYTRAA
ncbi:hypothetical protein ABZ490_47345 [Streptomyces sp. NPDC005811]|uniref:hypothetical protein n=1 Tax=Streptomyces sp. NPDC005811 TaxID=3154565 RepID=UPI0033F113AD